MKQKKHIIFFGHGYGPKRSRYEKTKIFYGKDIGMKKIFIITISLLSAAFLVLQGCSLFRDPGPAIVENPKEVEEAAETAAEDKGSSVEKNEDEETGEQSDSNDGGTEGGYFSGAILKAIDVENNTIVVEQLINDPDETIIEPEVVLAPDYKVVLSVLNIEAGEEKYTDIKLEDIPLESEIGIMFSEDNMAELIIYQVLEDLGDEEILKNTVLGFIEAVKIDEEYDYFSSGTIAIVGTEEEYRNGDNSDIYFIIKESHSTWEDIEITEINIEGNTG